MATSPESMPSGWGYGKPRERPTVVTVRIVRDAAPTVRRKPVGGHIKSKSSRIAYWLGGLRYEPGWKEIMTRWQVSRAGAYRWAAFAREAATHNVTEPRD